MVHEYVEVSPATDLDIVAAEPPVKHNPWLKLDELGEFVRTLRVYQGSLLARLAELDVALITSAPPSRSVPPLLAARAAGVTVAGGNDGIRDTWTPYGRPDMLARAMQIGLRYNLRRDRFHNGHQLDE